MGTTLLIGCIGNPNFGDEMIMRVWIEEYKKNNADKIILCDGVYPSNSAKIIKEMGYSNVLCINKSLSLFGHYGDIDFTPWGAKIENERNFFNKVKFLTNYLKDMDVDSIHIFGGGYFNEMWVHHFKIILISKIISLNLNCSLFATGHGLIPWGERSNRFLKLMNEFDLFDVRDIESFNVFSELENNTVSLTGDDVLVAIEDKSFLIQQEETPSIVISIQNDLLNGNGIISKIIDSSFILKMQEKRIKKIVFVSAMSLDVSNVPSDMEEEIKNSGISVSHINEMDLVKNGIPFHRESIYFTSRYHIHLIAALSGAKGVAFYENDYYENKHQSVINMGSEWDIFDSNYDESVKAAVENAFSSDKRCNQVVVNFWKSKKKKLITEIMNDKKKERLFSNEMALISNLLV